MCIFKRILEKRREKQRLCNEKCDMIIVQTDEAICEVKSMFDDILSFVAYEKQNEWEEKYKELVTCYKDTYMRSLKKAVNYAKLPVKKQELLWVRSGMKQMITEHNLKVAEARIANAYELLGDVEGRVLDRQQMVCIVKEARNHLVIAGAGTGKTTTIVGKIKYMLKMKQYEPKDILVLSFTNASASEMRERIHNETGCEIEASTFHKLGMNIVTRVDGIVPKITQINFHKFIKDCLKCHMQNDVYLNMLNVYLLYNRVASKSEFEFKTEQEYLEYLQLNKPTTINNEVVKSYGEMDIANFFEQHGIEYIYEAPYKYDTRTSEYQQYCPDFYLPEYDIYVEYFGVNRNYEVPSYFRGKNGKNATQVYRESIEWKRIIHQQFNTKMIECYAYERQEGVLLENLKRKLESNFVKVIPRTTTELWEKVAENDKGIVDGIVELFETLINLIKSNGYDINAVRMINANRRNNRDNELMLSLVEPIFEEYNRHLQNSGEIDFNDMINRAIQYVEEGKYINPYSCVIVDEYQDMAKARCNLLYSMRKTKDYELFCVGDDWQSIYRFAGSDIGFILYFDRYWGRTELSKIETTYRFTQNLIEISGSFIMKNPLQLKKSINGKQDTDEFPLAEICSYTDEKVIEDMVTELDKLPKDSSVFFIGRYSFDSELLRNNSNLVCKYNNVSGMVEVVYRNRNDLYMNFITAHKSKGLQADYVFIINNKSSRMGFPSKIQDAAILELLLENSDNYAYAEERRLFYVALTRAKKKVYLLTVKGHESVFVKELEDRYKNELKIDVTTEPRCPMCGDGKLVKRKGKYGEFIGCSNYAKNGCTYIQKKKYVGRVAPMGGTVG